MISLDIFSAVFKKIGCLWILCLSSIVGATSPSDTASPSSTYPKIGLVLSGGGARGLAHIGVLKVLRDENIPVHVITGTSMGSIIGGAYAQGWSVDEIEKFALHSDWNQMFNDSNPRSKWSFRDRDMDYKNPSQLEFGFDKDGLELPEGTFGSTSLERTLRELTLRSSKISNTDQLPVPMRAIATDIGTGKLVELNQPNLFSILRASMSVPGAFAPITINNQLLVDGGVVRNFPVQEAQNMGADIIIGVDVSSPLNHQDQIKSAFDIAGQITRMVTVRNVEESIHSMRDNDILIQPELTGVSFLKFDNVPDIIAKGEAAARAVLPKLRQLSRQPEQYAQWNTARIAALPQTSPAHTIADIEIKGTLRANKAALKEKIEIQTSRQLTPTEIEEKMHQLNTNSEYQRIDWQLKPDNMGAGEVIEIQPIEGAFADNRFRFGLRLETDFSRSHAFDILVQHRKTWLNQWGLEWNNTLQIGNTRQLVSELRQPLGADSPWFISTQLAYQGATLPFYEDTQQVAATRYHVGYGRLLFGRQLSDWGKINLGLYRSLSKLIIDLPQSFEQPSLYKESGIDAELTVDTLNSGSFPTQGVRADVQLYKAFNNPDESYRLKTSALVAGGAGKWAWHGFGLYSNSNLGLLPIKIGGFMRLSGTPVQASHSGNTILLRAMAARKIGALAPGLGGDMRIGGSVEYGGSFNQGQPFQLRDLKKALTGFLQMDTRFGPLWLGMGHTFPGKTAVYLFFGQP